MEKYELLDLTVGKLMQRYHGLDRAFVRGFPNHPFYDDVGERWVPNVGILEPFWSTGERIMVAVLLDIFHDEYGITDYLDYDGYEDSDDYVRPAERVWKNVRPVTHDFPYLDPEPFRLLCQLIYR
ncbi:MAG: hypothetical protein IH613_13260 [Desulfuromonadales bacterium]|nr:hypothetical protein [Desulfuromonadales bacterium]